MMKKLLSLLILISMLIIPTVCAYHNQIWCNANNAEVYLDEEFIGRIQNGTFKFDYNYDPEIAPHFLRIYHPNYDEWWGYLPQDDYYDEIVLGVLGENSRQDGIITISTFDHEEISGAEVYIQHSLHYNTTYTFEGLTPLTLILPEGRYHYMVWKQGYQTYKGMDFVVPSVEGQEDNSVINWDVFLIEGDEQKPTLQPTQKPFPTPLPTATPITIEKEVIVKEEVPIYIKQYPSLFEQFMSGLFWGILLLSLLLFGSHLYLDRRHNINFITAVKDDINNIKSGFKDRLKHDKELAPKYDLLSKTKPSIRDDKLRFITKVLKWKSKVEKIFKILKE